MKKLTLLALICCLLLTFAAAEPLPAPTEEAVPATLLDRVLLIAEDGAELIQMTEDDLLDLIGIDYEEYTDFAYLAAADALAGRELIVLCAADEEAAERIVELLQSYLEQRMRETRNYLPETYQLLSEAEVIREELMVVLSIAAPNANEVELLLMDDADLPLTKE